uniref:Wzy n=1 Tax=Proteus vulgaris TaxID=585 RepID=A0A385JMC8_PROVU|nr:wzy [Proteus vulgaris]
MNYNEFLDIYFSNLSLFLTCGFISIILCFYSVNFISIAGITDPIHFFWTYTLGTTYSIIIGLFILGYISNDIIILIGISIVSLLLSIYIGYAFKINLLKHPINFIIEYNNGYRLFKILLFLMCAFYTVIIYKVGFSIFSEVNRFEQNKGIGPLVRVVDAIRPFVLSYMAIYIGVYTKGYKKIIYNSILISLIIVSSLSNGAKFALLEIVYAISACFILYRGHRLKVSMKRLIKIFSIFLVVFSFALIATNYAIKAKGENMKPQFLPENTPIAIEKIYLRTLSNGDQAYLGLPNEIINKIPTGNIIYNFTSSMIGKEKFKNIFGINDNLNNVGQKILLFHFPDYDQAGGPVSHFDLYFYHYLPIGLNYIAIFVLGLVLVSIVNCKVLAKGNIFISALISTLWIRGLVMILEPAMGFVYILDFLFIIFFITLITIILPKKRKKDFINVK